jgi:cytochrome c heme-lyase
LSSNFPEGGLDSGVSKSRNQRYYFIPQGNRGTKLNAREACIIDFNPNKYFQAQHNMSKAPENVPEVCPVDHKTRAAWLNANPTSTFPGQSKEANQASKGNSCDSTQVLDQQTPPTPQGFFSRWFSSPPPAPVPAAPKILGEDREISTIPRASAVDNRAGARPANSEGEGGVSESGNWIYPSEKMFFEAMKRKGHEGRTADMKTIVPMHNAINERSWKEIKEWERPYGAEKE